MNNSCSVAADASGLLLHILTVAMVLATLRVVGPYPFSPQRRVRSQKNRRTEGRKDGRTEGRRDGRVRRHGNRSGATGSRAWMDQGRKDGRAGGL